MSGTLDFSTHHVMVGTHRITGRAKGDSVSIAYTNPAFTLVTGVDGNSYWVKQGDRSASITLLLGMNSLSNTVLSTLHLADLNTPGGVQVPLIIRQGQSLTSFACTRARIVKLPDTAWSDGGNTRSWEFQTGRLEGFISSLDESIIAPAELLAA